MHGHTLSSCNIGMLGVPNGHYVSIQKGQFSKVTNKKGSNINWVPEIGKCALEHDSGFSRHMICDRSKYQELSLKEKVHVTYGDNNRGKILRVGKFGNATQATIDKL
ncbi:hypothetical protein Lal_00016115 [Lupinus albus]|nr:hypothetical protein Lal_00016115 [Lupinus albus]